VKGDISLNTSISAKLLVKGGNTNIAALLTEPEKSKLIKENDQLTNDRHAHTEDIES
jgi:hypothetical protein